MVSPRMVGAATRGSLWGPPTAAGRVASCGASTTPLVGSVLMQVRGLERTAGHAVGVAAVNTCWAGRIPAVVALSPEEIEVDGFRVTVAIAGVTSAVCCTGEVAVWACVCFSFFLHLARLFWNQTW